MQEKATPMLINYAQNSQHGLMSGTCAQAVATQMTTLSRIEAARHHGGHRGPAHRAFEEESRADGLCLGASSRRRWQCPRPEPSAGNLEKRIGMQLNA